MRQASHGVASAALAAACDVSDVSEVSDVSDVSGPDGTPGAADRHAARPGGSLAAVSGSDNLSVDVSGCQRPVGQDVSACKRDVSGRQPRRRSANLTREDVARAMERMPAGFSYSMLQRELGGRGSFRTVKRLADEIRSSGVPPRMSQLMGRPGLAEAGDMLGQVLDFIYCEVEAQLEQKCQGAAAYAMEVNGDCQRRLEDSDRRVREAELALARAMEEIGEERKRRLSAEQAQAELLNEVAACRRTIDILKSIIGGAHPAGQCGMGAVSMESKEA